MKYLTLAKVNIDNQKVLLRTDLNVPMRDGKITDESRIIAALPTIKYILENNAGLIIMSHLGRPKEGEADPELTLAPIATLLAEKLGREVRLVSDAYQQIELQPGEVVMLENVRFNKGESENSPQLAQAYAALCDVFVMDAFATAHRAQASTAGVAEYAPIACAGPLLNHELQAIHKATTLPEKPVVAIVGGSKVSSKLKVLQNLLGIVDVLITGGGIANTLLLAQGRDVGASLVEKDQLDVATTILKSAAEKNVSMPLPTDVVVADSFAEDSPHRSCTLDAVQSNEMILDIGQQSCADYKKYIITAGTILWNGPVGVFEWPAFETGTAEIGAAIASSSGFSVAGGGDTLAAINKFHLAENIDFCSTGGGAFLECLEGETLPAVQVLINRAESA